MPRDLVPSQKNHAVTLSTPSTEVLRITGLSSYSNNLKSLAKANKDWNLTPEQVVAAGKVNRRIYRIRFTNKPVRFSPSEENPETTYVYVNDLIIGILDVENTAKLKALIASSDVHSVTCIIQGGLYKIVDKSCNEEIQQKGISASIRITHQPQAAAVPATNAKRQTTPKKQGKKSSRKTTTKESKHKKSRTKKPLYKRVWVWILAAILALGSCGNETDTTVPTETTVPIIGTIQTESTPESTLPPTTESTPTETPTTIPTTEPATVPTTEAYAMPIAEPTTVPTTPPYEVPITESFTEPYSEPITEEEITVYLSKTGSKYHSKPNCGRMKDGTPVVLNSTIKNNYEPCKNCH